MKSNGRFCTRCKQGKHLDKYCKNKNKYAKCILNSIWYLLFAYKGANGVRAKFIGAPIVGSKKKVIWVPKSLVTNLQGLKQV
jgi:hypothetical protein